MPRRFSLTRIAFLDSGFLSAIFIDPWGEGAPIIARIHDNTSDETENVKYWAFFAANTAPDSIVLDVATFVGLLALAAASIRLDIKAVSFDSLVHNTIWNGFDLRVILFNLAASTKQGFSRFPYELRFFSKSLGEEIRSVQRLDHTQPAATIPLDMRQEDKSGLLDYLNATAIPFGPLTAITGVKIDVEGHESAVLEGSGKLIATHRPPFICEALDTSAHDATKGFFGGIGCRGIRIEHESNIVFIADKKSDVTTRSYRQWQAARGQGLTYAS